MTTETIETRAKATADAPADPAVRKILVVEDDPTARHQLRELLRLEQNLAVDVAGDGAQALELLEAGNYSVLVTDLKMPGLSGIELIHQIKQRGLDVAIIVTTGHGSMANAIAAMRSGADDFLTKPIDLDHLQLAIGRLLRERRLRDEVASLRQQLSERFSFQNVISKHPRMLAIFDLISHIADSNSTVLIEGETGTGKEQIARAIHQASQRRQGPMVAVNCAALPETLLESELFGHEKGAFTGAINRRVGRFEAANGGTLFLDEVGDIPAVMQAKLLRVLQEHQIERLGSHETLNVDARIIAATNRSLRALVDKGDFREDLFYRLNVVRLELPPLRERKEDIPLLVAHFASKYTRPGERPKRIDPAAMEALLEYDWPGNIRELENVMEYACATSRGEVITAANLPKLIMPLARQAPAVAVDLNTPLPELIARLTEATEREYIEQALAKSYGNVGKCAQICGLSRRSISAKLTQYGIQKANFK